MKKVYTGFILLLVALPPVVAQQWNIAGSAFTTIARGLYFVDETTGYACSEAGGIAKTVDGGVTWTQQTSNVITPLRSIFFLNEEDGYTCGFGGVILKTTNGGATWADLGDTIIRNLRCIEFTSETNGYAAAAGGVIHRTTDGGATWSPYDLGTTSDVIQLHFVNPDVGFAVASGAVSPFGSGFVYKTTNGGNTWSMIHEDPLVGFLGLAATDENNIFIGGSYQTLKQTADGGATWTVVTQNTIGTPTFRGGTAASAQNIYMIDDGGNIFNTSDGGASWTSTFVLNGFYSISFPTDIKGYVGDAIGTIYTTSPACASPSDLVVLNVSSNAANVQWTAVSDAMGYRVSYHEVGSAVGFKKNSQTNTKLLKNLTPSTKYKWAVQSVCATGPLVASLNIPGPDFTTAPYRFGLDEAINNTVDIFPNPASENATISFTLDESSDVRITLTDLNGRIMSEITNQSYDHGSHQLTFDPGVAAGLYLITITTNDEVITRQLTIQ